jgi:hypothetical protein
VKRALTRRRVVTLWLGGAAAVAFGRGLFELGVSSGVAIAAGLALGLFGLAVVVVDP